jgi:hypothetical protein
MPTLVATKMHPVANNKGFIIGKALGGKGVPPYTITALSIFCKGFIVSKVISPG